MVGMTTHWDHCMLEVSQTSIDQLTFDYMAMKAAERFLVSRNWCHFSTSVQ